MAPRPSGPKKFAELGCLSPETVEVLSSLGFHTTTPVQEATIPLFCGHKDVAVDACTGSGKTLAFVLPVVERLRRLEEPLKAQQVGAIIVSPTRELAKQIYGVAQPFVASVPNLTSMLLVGGTDPAADVSALRSRGGHVLVGTPGRIEDVLKRCAAADLKRLEVLVLDEADRLLDMGFKAQLDALMARLPRQRRTGLFSATQTEAVQELARAGLRNPVRVNVAVNAAAPPAAQAGKQAEAEAEGKGKKGKEKGKEKEAAAAEAESGGDADAEAEARLAAEEEAEDGAAAAASQKTPNSLSIQYVVCEPDEKIPQLVRFLALHGKSQKIIVYGMTCAVVDWLAAALPRLPPLRGLAFRALHGRMKQAARETTLEAFRGLAAGALLCTDLAARGLDIPDVHWVVQLDPPQDPAAFVHRVGRTARMGRSGAALVMLGRHEETYVEFLRLRKVPMTEAEPLPPTGADGGAATDGPSTSGRDAAAAAATTAAAVNGKSKGGKGASKGASGAGAAAGAAGVGGGAAGMSTATADVLAALRRAVETDRDVMDKATRAFVTYVRGYKEHHCKFIFRLQDLNIGRLATGLGLLRLPRMPDLKRPLGAESFVPSPVDPASVPFKDKAREKQRQKLLQQRQAEAAARGGGAHANAAAAAAAAAAKRKAAAEAPEARLPAAKRRQLQQIDETDALNREYSLLKKLKKGKITQHQYDKAIGLGSDSEPEPEPGSDSEADEDGGAAAGRGRNVASAPAAVATAGDDSGSDGGDDGDGDEEGAPGHDRPRAGAGAGKPAGAKQGGGGGGRAPGKGRQRGAAAAALASVKQPRGALQSYIDKKARKKKKRRSAAKQGAQGQ